MVLTETIKSMMTLRGCNMAVCAYQSDEGKFVMLDAYEEREGIWYSGIIPIIDDN